ncbi:GNAT family N-acetyltransferase [Virgibacillus necropolis]|uniref:GNAT family N-acetyltransferase n=1 Tax=Virgibacillus necropolis TaxID=163877 RepID=A0A221MFI4_9BACI|nr:GNAT family N-acetyltransferase [Virgibacillus necropolis]ASN06407.1 GNAT family N-acetyltransferase [Virgibacillus necropolis]
MRLLFEKEAIRVRHLQSDDKQLLVKWLSTPSVLEYYEGRDNPFDLEKVNKDFYSLDNGVSKFLVLYEGINIGYIQYYQVNDKTSSINDYSEDETNFGIDQFIGETEYWNKGIGTLLVSSMVEYLVEQKQAERVVMDPQVTNVRALKCYEKCGFKKVRILPKREFHEGEFRDCWLMEYKEPKKMNMV